MKKELTEHMETYLNLRANIPRKLLEKAELTKKERQIFLDAMETIKLFEKKYAEQYGEESLYEFKIQAGVYSPDGIYEWVDGIGAIDQFLAPIILELNQRGYTTRFCCSGIQSEHTKTVKSGYIMFKLNEIGSKLNVLKQATHVADMILEYPPTKEGKITHQQKVVIRTKETDDETKKKSWNTFIAEIRKHSTYKQ